MAQTRDFPLHSHKVLPFARNEIFENSNDSRRSGLSGLERPLAHAQLQQPLGLLFRWRRRVAQ